MQKYFRQAQTVSVCWSITVDVLTYLKGSCLWWLGGRWLCPNKGIYCLWLYIPTLWSACLL